MRPEEVKDRNISTIVRLQLTYVAIAIIWNIVSQIRLALGQTPLSPASIVWATIIFAIYLGAVALGVCGYVRIFRVVMAIIALRMAYGGILPHYWRGFSPALYTVPFFWVAAMVLNFFGLIVTALGAWKGPFTSQLSATATSP